MLYRRVLVAYDGSGLADKALKHAIGLVKTGAALEIDVLHIVKFAVTAGTLYAVADEHAPEALQEHGRQVLARAEKLLGREGIQGRTVMVEGVPGDTIVQYAKANQFDLIVVGCRGFSGLKEFLLGSVSHYIAQHSELPVLIVK